MRFAGLLSIALLGFACLGTQPAKGYQGTELLVTSSQGTDLSYDTYLLSASGLTDITLTISDLTNDDGVITYFRRIDTNALATVTIQMQPGQTIEGSNSYTVLPNTGLITVVAGGKMYFLANTASL